MYIRPWIEGLEKVTKAISFAQKKHKGQKDDSGKDYFDAHLYPVFEMIKLLTDNTNVWCAALLHDTLEDTKTTEAELRKEFGDVITDLVLEVTHEGKPDNHGYYFPRLKTKEGYMIKYLDRASNISRMDAWDEGRRQHYLKRSKFWKSEPKNH